MPLVDYATWYREQQALRERNPNLNLGPIGTQGIQEYEGYQAPRFGQIDKDAAKYNLDVLKAGAQGYVAGGPIGAAISAAIAAAPQVIKSGKQAWEAAKTGDPRAVSRSLAPVSPVLYLHEKSGLPSWTNPVYFSTKLIGELFGGPRTQVEEKRWDALKKAGFDVPKWVAEGKDIKDTGFRQDLDQNFVGFDEKGEWVNNKFAKSRNESDLTAKDINQYAVMPETFGSMWKTAADETKEKVANLAIEGGAKLREHHGTLDIQWKPETLKMAQDILAGDFQRTAAGQAPAYWVPPTWEPPEERMRKYGKLY